MGAAISGLNSFELPLVYVEDRTSAGQKKFAFVRFLWRQNPWLVLLYPFFLMVTPVFSIRSVQIKIENLLLGYLQGLDLSLTELKNHLSEINSEDAAILTTFLNQSILRFSTEISDMRTNTRDSEESIQMILLLKKVYQLALEISMALRDFHKTSFNSYLDIDSDAATSDCASFDDVHSLMSDILK